MPGALGKKLAALDPAHFAEASGRLEIKAQRAAQRREEQQRHEKNVREGRRRKAPTPKKPDAPPSREPKRAARPKTGVPGGKAPGARPQRGGRSHPGAKPAQRWAGSRPVKKGKGSDRGDKK